MADWPDTNLDARASVAGHPEPDSYSVPRRISFSRAVDRAANDSVLYCDHQRLGRRGDPTLRAKDDDFARSHGNYLRGDSARSRAASPGSGSIGGHYLRTTGWRNIAGIRVARTTK